MDEAIESGVDVNSTIEQKKAYIYDGEENDTDSKQIEPKSKNDNQEENGGKDDTSAHSHGYLITESVPGVFQFFLDRFLGVLKRYGAVEDDCRGWRVEILKRTGGLSALTIDVYYIYNSDWEKTSDTISTSGYSLNQLLNALHPKEKLYRSRVEAACGAGFMPHYKVLSQMTRDQMHEHSVETRDRFVVSQHLQVHGFKCFGIELKDEIEHGIMAVANDNICFTEGCSSDTDPNTGHVDVSEIVRSVKPDKDICFAFGNCTVLDWGRILPNNPAFHTKSQLYPFGFKCIRQEQDLVLHTIVDCLCEILSVPDVNVETDSDYSKCSPLFRITVSWLIDAPDIDAKPSQPEINNTALDTDERFMYKKCSRVVRVYEGKTPQQAWQGVLLETIGTAGDESVQYIEGVSTESGCEKTSNKMENNSSAISIPEDVADKHKSAPPGICAASVTEMDEVDANAVGETDQCKSPTSVSRSPPVMDREEIELREAIRVAKKDYYRALKNAQSSGVCGALTPRLAIENPESFFDEVMMRFVEGLTGSVECVSYQFMDARMKDGGKKHLSKALSKMQHISKSVEKVDKRRIASLMAEEKESLKRIKALESQSGLLSAAHKDSGGGSHSRTKKRRLYWSSIEGGELGEQVQGRKRRRRRVDGVLCWTYKGQVVSTGDDDALRNGVDENGQSVRRPEGDDVGSRSQKGPTGARQRIALVSQQKQKLLELEKIARKTREAAHRETKKLKDEMKQRAEGLCCGELVGNFAQPICVSNSDKCCSLPLPTQGPVSLSGDTYGKLLENWSFWVLFSRQLNLKVVPQLDLVSAALHACEPSVRLLRQQRNCISGETSLEYQRFLAANEDMSDISQAYNMWNSTMTSDEAEALLNKLGGVLCAPLIDEYCECMGMLGDNLNPAVSEQQLNEVKTQLLNGCVGGGNIWKEILRVVLLASAYRELGASQAEILMAVKGKGFTVVPDAAEKRVMKLVKKRIVHNFMERKENREALIGFGAGVCARIPAPLAALPDAHNLWNCKKVWKRCIDMLALYTTDGCAWKLYEVALVMMQICDQCEDFWLSNAGKRDGVKLPAGFAALAAKMKKLKIILSDSLSTQMVRSSVSCAKLRGVLLQMFEAVNDCCMGESDEVKSEHEFLSMSVERWYFASLLDVCSVLVDRQSLATAASLGSNEFLASCEDNVRSLMKSYKENELTNLCMKVENWSETFDSSFIKKEADVDDTAASISKNDEESRKVMGLSLAMQRCYMVVRDIMTHPQSTILNYPVDHNELRTYYEVISQPLSFFDIREHVLNGLYEGNIYGFYKDMNLVIDNALAYNADGCGVANSAHKLRIVLDRLFYEIVLSWDCPLPSHDCCPICRNADVLSVNEECIEDPVTVAVLETSVEEDSKATNSRLRNRDSLTNLQLPEKENEKPTPLSFLQCERCESCYHISCLIATSPSVSATKEIENLVALGSVKVKDDGKPGREWFCPGCVEQKSIAHIHPCKLSTVRHPVKSTWVDNRWSYVGEVVGIEQYKGHLLFIVGFNNDSCREVWTPQQIRKNCLSWEGNVTHECSDSSSLPNIRQDTGSSSTFLPCVPNLPDRYGFEDYDNVCSFARGYAGWGASSCNSPLFINEHYNLEARRRSYADDTFKSYLDALAFLGGSHVSSSSGISNIFQCESSGIASLSATEWILLFTAARNKLLTLPIMTDFVLELEGDNDVASSRTRDVVNKLMMNRLDAVGSCTNLLSSTVRGIALGDMSGCVNNDDSSIVELFDMTSVSPSAARKSIVATVEAGYDVVEGIDELIEDPIVEEATEPVKKESVSNSKSNNKLEKLSVKSFDYSSEEEFDCSPDVRTLVPSFDTDFDDAMAEMEEENDLLCAEDDNGGGEGVERVIEAVDLDDAMKETVSDEVTADKNKVETVEEWELRRDSRVRGREDALMVVQQMPDLLKLIDQQDLDDQERYAAYKLIVAAFHERNKHAIAGSGHIEDGDGAEHAESNMYATAVGGGTMFSTVLEGIDGDPVATPGLLSVAKGVVPKLSNELLNLKEWEKAFELKLDNIVESLFREIEETSDASVAGEMVNKKVEVTDVSPYDNICDCCGLNEASAASALVQCCTLDEWNAQVLTLLTADSAANKKSGKSSANKSPAVPAISKCCGRPMHECTSCNIAGKDEGLSAQSTSVRMQSVEEQTILRNLWILKRDDNGESETGDGVGKPVHGGMRPVYWIPCNSSDAVVENEEYENIRPRLPGSEVGSVQNRETNYIKLCGSLKMHEYCANIVHSTRAEALLKRKKEENRNLVDVLEGLTRGKVVPIGCDYRRHDAYFVLPSVPYLFVMHGDTHCQNDDATFRELGVSGGGSYRMCGGAASTMDAFSLAALGIELKTTNNGLLEQYFHAQKRSAKMGNFVEMDDEKILEDASSRWSVYKKGSDIQHLIKALDCTVECEKKLLNVLTILFPCNAAPMMESISISDTTFLASVDSFLSHINQVENLSSKVEVLAEGTTDPGEIEEEIAGEGTENREPDLVSVKTPPVSSSGRPIKPVIQKPVKTPAPSAIKNKSGNIPSKFKVGDQVLVENGKSQLLWEGVVVDSSVSRTLNSVGTGVDGKGAQYFKVKFENWYCNDSYSDPDSKCLYSGWFPSTNLLLLSSARLQAQTRKQLVDETIFEYPVFMTQLRAFKYMGAADRCREDNGNSISKGLDAAFAAYGYESESTESTNGRQYSMCTNNDSGAVAALHLLKYSLLMMEACLPTGAIDAGADDKWSIDESDCSFSEMWRESVIASNDAVSLMQSVLFLEYCIKSNCFAFTSGGGRSPHPSANGHLFTSRIYALRNASIPLIAMRIFALDLCIRYDKVIAPSALSGGARTSKAKKRK